jgi:hypothetical protein
LLEPLALDLRCILAQPMAPAWLTLPAKTQALEDKPRATNDWGLLGAAL